MISTFILLSATLFSSNTVCATAISESKSHTVQCKMAPGISWGVANVNSGSQFNFNFDYKSQEFKTKILNQMDLTTFDCMMGLLLSQSVPTSWFEGNVLKKNLNITAYKVCTFGDVDLIYIPENENNYLIGEQVIKSDLLLFSVR